MPSPLLLAGQLHPAGILTAQEAVTRVWPGLQVGSLAMEVAAGFVDPVVEAFTVPVVVARPVGVFEGFAGVVVARFPVATGTVR